MRCRSCLVPSQVPGVTLGTDGVCNLCKESAVGATAASPPAETWRASLDHAVEQAKAHRGQYQVLVCLSGGKDSLYLLHKTVKELGLRTLAFTVDANIPPVAWSSIERTVRKLKVDHLIYRPDHDFYKRLFRHLLTHQEERGAVYTVSYVYAPLFEGDALRVATERGIPLVLAGYSPGQPDPARMAFEFSRELICATDWTPPALRNSQDFSDEDRARFWNPAHYPPEAEFPRYIAPFHAWDYDQELIMREVARLDYVRRRAHADPVNSNYPINWLLMYSDLKHFGYNPYAPEFAALIREGKASRLRWWWMAPFVDWMIRNKALLGKEVRRQLDELELDEKDLRITMPRGAYDPDTVKTHE
jgi:hypothetical protein